MTNPEDLRARKLIDWLSRASFDEVRSFWEVSPNLERFTAQTQQAETTDIRVRVSTLRYLLEIENPDSFDLSTTILAGALAVSKLELDEELARELFGIVTHHRLLRQGVRLSQEGLPSW